MAYAKEAGHRVPIRAGAVAMCMALLTTATVGVVIVQKMSIHLPVMGWAKRETYYRNWHGLALFLMKGLGKKLKEEDMLQKVSQYEVVEEFKPQFEVAAIEDLFKEHDERALLDSVVLIESQNSEDNRRASGYILLPSVVAKFAMTVRKNLEIEITLRHMADDRVIYHTVLHRNDVES